MEVPSFHIMKVSSFIMEDDSDGMAKFWDDKIKFPQNPKHFDGSMQDCIISIANT